MTDYGWGITGWIIRVQDPSDPHQHHAVATCVDESGASWRVVYYGNGQQHSDGLIGTPPPHMPPNRQYPDAATVAREGVLMWPNPDLWWHRRYHTDNSPGARLLPCAYCFNEWRTAYLAAQDAMYERHAAAMAAIRERYFGSVAPPPTAWRRS